MTSSAFGILCAGVVSVFEKGHRSFGEGATESNENGKRMQGSELRKKAGNMRFNHIGKEEREGGLD